MDFLTHFYKGIIIVSLLKLIVCQNLNKNEKINLITKLLHVMNAREMEKQQLLQVKQNINSIGKTGVADLFNKRVLVKRFLPHSYPLLEYEYDEKTNTLYRPLLRLHKGKPRVHFRGDSEVILENRPAKPLYETLRNDVYKYREEDLPQQESQTRKVTFRSILDDVATYISKVQSASEMRRLKYAVLSLLENYPKKFLRHRFHRDSNESPRQHQHFHEHNKEQGKDEKKQKKKLMPEYPFWNYWTVTKTIHQDQCKGNLVLFGNVCIKTPSH